MGVQQQGVPTGGTSGGDLHLCICLRPGQHRVHECPCGKSWMTDTTVG